MGAGAIRTKFRVERLVVAAVEVAVLPQSLPMQLSLALGMAPFVAKVALADGLPLAAATAALRLLITRLLLPAGVGVERITSPPTRLALKAQMAVVVLVNMVEIPDRVVLEPRITAVTETLVALVAVAVRTVTAVTAKWAQMIVGALAVEAATVRTTRLPSNVSALVVLALESDVVESAVRLTAGQAGIHSKANPRAVAVRRLRVYSGVPVAVVAAHTIRA